MYKKSNNIKLYLYPPIWGLPSLSPFCSKVYYQGIARHNREEIYQKGIDDFLAVETYLRQKSLQRTLIDVTLYPFLNTINNTPINNLLKNFISDSQIISDYLSHFNEIV